MISRKAQEYYDQKYYNKSGHIAKYQPEKNHGEK